MHPHGIAQQQVARPLLRMGSRKRRRIILDPVPDCSDIPKGPSRPRAIIGAISHISHGGNRRSYQQQQRGLGPTVLELTDDRPNHGEVS